MERLIKIPFSELNTTLRALSDAGEVVGDTVTVTWNGSAGGDNASLVIKFIHEQRKLADNNPFKQTVEEQLAALRRQNELGGWDISEDVFARLAETAPEWPEGRDAYRSFRIRFGKGRNGMIQTFEAHAAAIERVHDKYWRWELLLSGEHPYQDKPVDRLRLLAGNDTHHAVVEWIIIPDLSQYRKHSSITSVRGPKSLADEGLVLAWLVPERVHAINSWEWCAWFCAGYELNVPERGGESWRSVVIVHRNPDDGTMGLGASCRSTADSRSSVPSVG